MSDNITYYTEFPPPPPVFSFHIDWGVFFIWLGIYFAGMCLTGMLAKYLGYKKFDSLIGITIFWPFVIIGWIFAAPAWLLSNNKRQA